MSDLWVVLYQHVSGSVVVMGLYEDEQEAENTVQRLRKDSSVVKAWKTREPVFYYDR